MAPEGLLPSSQEKVTGAYPQRHACNPHLATLFP